MKKKCIVSIIIVYCMYFMLSYFFYLNSNDCIVFRKLIDKYSFYNFLINYDNAVNLCYLILVIILIATGGWILRYNFFKQETFRLQEVVIFLLFVVCTTSSIILYENSKSNYNISIEYILYALFTNSLLVAIIEELFFRTLILQLMLIVVNSNEKYIVIIINGILFALMHMFNIISNIKIIGYSEALQGFVMICLLSCLLAACYITYKNVIICILVHAGYNMTTSLVLDSARKKYLMLYIGLITLILVVRNIKERKRVKWEAS